MARIVIFLFALIIATSVNCIESVNSIESIEKIFESDFNRNGSTKNDIVAKVECAAEVTEELAQEFGIQGLWRGAQDRIVGNIDSLFGCLKFDGFKGRR